jgi:hypothetical protein
VVEGRSAVVLSGGWCVVVVVVGAAEFQGVSVVPQAERLRKGRTAPSTGAVS